jgi:hypothetical protein
MIGYVTLGTNDRVRGAAFYDAIAAELGVRRMMENEQFIAWGTPGGGAGIGLTRPLTATRQLSGTGSWSHWRQGTERKLIGCMQSRSLMGAPMKARRTSVFLASMPAISVTPTATSSTRSSWRLLQTEALPKRPRMRRGRWPKRKRSQMRFRTLRSSSCHRASRPAYLMTAQQTSLSPLVRPRRPDRAPPRSTLA